MKVGSASLGHNVLHHERKKNELKFFLVVGERNTTIWVGPVSHYFVKYSDKDKMHVVICVEFEEVKIDKFPIFARREHVQHVELDERKHSLLHHSFLIAQWRELKMRCLLQIVTFRSGWQFSSF